MPSTLFENRDASLKYIPLESQHSPWRPSAAEGNQQAPLSEPASFALVRAGKGIFSDCLVHIFPIAVTIVILLANGLGWYWKDSEYDWATVTVQYLQYAAKLHEIAMGVSLAEIVLQRINYSLCTSDGLPLGLVTAAHQISSLPYFMSIEFFRSCRLPPGIRAKISRASLLGMIVICFLLTMLMGPSSAVALIPRLDWWDHTNPYPEGPERTFVRYKASDLWPTSITTQLIPPGCADSGSPDAAYCPYSGYEMVSDWVSAHQNEGQAPNITVPGQGGVARLLASSRYDSSTNLRPPSTPLPPDEKNSGNTTAWTVGYKEAWDLGAFWQYAVEKNRSIGQTSRPRIAPRFVDDEPIRKPAVEVVCAAHYSWSMQDLAQSLGDPWLAQLRSQPKFDALFSDVVEGTQAHLGQIPTAFSWIDPSYMVNGSIGAVFAVNTPNDSVALVPCSVVAYWQPASLFLDPKSDMIIHEQAVSAEQSSNWSAISIASDWADAMNPNITDDNGVETTYIQRMVERYNYNSSNPVILSEPGYGQESIPWRISTALGLYLTEALARVHSSYLNATVICHTNSTNQEQVFILGNLNADDQQWWPRNQSFIDYAHEQGWAELEFKISRYGYSWGFEGFVVIAASAVLVLQALIGLAHLGYIVCGGWLVPSWATMGEMLVLAIKSSPSARLETATQKRGDQCDHFWAEPVKIRETKEKKLELVMDGGLPPEREREVGLTMPRKRRKNR
ncbi:MAG: hypothetical protein Q9168_006375 [Polycauliona sp. 1 TL-2023]